MRIAKTGILLFFTSFFFLGIGCRDLPDTAELREPLPEKVSFNFHIRPILADRCFSCHGPDEVARKGDLRLDYAEHAYARLETGKKALHPGKVKKSEAWHRIYSADPEWMMPPPESNLSLNAYEKALITKWIKQGAVYEEHWAFLPPQMPTLPKVKAKEATQNEIDHFVLAELEKNGLSFSPPAAKEQLLRRLTFDLTGLPPSLEEIDAFFKDEDPQAYEKVVDRLLASDAYAERMTMDWLDLARYADSQGLHSDGWRSMYPWRDWVISAFKRNMPFDQFISWQLAGDLYPQPNREQLVATAFNRNHKVTAEGGIVDEEYRMEYVHDRVATTGAVFMGLTMECARCHDHKYDPISQKDYYQFAAYFNQVDELGMTGDDGNAGPNLLLPSKKTQERLQKLQTEIEQKEKELVLTEKSLAAQANFIARLKNNPKSFLNEQTIHLPFNQIVNGQVDGNPVATVSEGAELVQGKSDKALEINKEYEFVTVKGQGLFEQNEAFSASIWIHPHEQRTSQTIVGNTGQKGTFWRGWDLSLDSLNHLSFRLIHALPHDVIGLYTKESIPLQEWTHVAFSYDGMGRARGVRLYINGEKKETEVRFDRLARSIHPIRFNKEKNETPLRLGKSYRAFTGEYGIFAGKMDEFRLFSRVLSSLEVDVLAGNSDFVTRTLEYEKDPSSELEMALFDTWRLQYSHPLEKEISDLRLQQINLLDTVPEVMIMDELEKPRPTFVLARGNYDQPGEKVLPGVLKNIWSFSDTLKKNRLDLVKWLLDPEHPLTSRVTVNRFWQQFFGQGLVNTSHDFGLQGSLPTHPELLDLLAIRFIESGWNVKEMQKLIVMSSTYQQSSKVSLAVREKDPANTLLSRGPSYRLPAEMIRDNALAASGLLSEKVGGPSVKPVQPKGLWREKTSSTYILRAYEPDTGSARYRRSLYTFLRRTSPHPAMTAFDAPNRSVCTAQRQRTNTPLQALVLLNDPQFVEASRELAEEVLSTFNQTEDQINHAFRLLTGRKPSQNKKEQLLDLYREERERFSKEQEAARQFLSIGQYPFDATLEIESLASMTLVVNTIMNYDEFYMKR